jgi:hypothetical protein
MDEEGRKRKSRDLKYDISISARTCTCLQHYFRSMLEPNNHKPGKKKSLDGILLLLANPILMPCTPFFLMYKLLFHHCRLIFRSRCIVFLSLYCLAFDSFLYW